MSGTALRELIMTDGQLDEITVRLGEQAGYDWCVDSLLAIRESTPDYKELTPMDSILWILRCAFLMGHRSAMELMRELIRRQSEGAG